MQTVVLLCSEVMPCTGIQVGPFGHTRPHALPAASEKKRMSLSSGLIATKYQSTTHILTIWKGEGAKTGTMLLGFGVGRR
jgi:hypothetical protein